MKLPSITFVEYDDWEGLYLDGKLVLEGHSLDTSHVLDALGISHSSVWVSDAQIEKAGCLPERLAEVEHATEEDLNPCYCAVCKPQ